MKISVTKHYIAKGKPLYPDRCPVALAMTAALGEEIYVIGGLYRPATGGAYYALPLKVRKFVNDFDSGMTVKPFTFSIRRKS
jgi:hypothetical protein